MTPPHNDDFDFEPIPGLPAALPAGEHILWQGTPGWRHLALRSYHVRKVALYFGALTLWTVVHGAIAGDSANPAISCALLVLAGTAAVAVLTLLAYLSARSTVYTVTTHRVLIRHGIAVPMTLNLPFGHIDAVSLRDFADGTGELALRVGADDRVGYLITWPHVRARVFKHPEPTLVAIAAARDVAACLVEAISPQTRVRAPAGRKTLPAERPVTA